MKPFKFILGGIIGATSALLFAPRSGKETRELVSGKVEEYMSGDSPVAEKVRDTADKVKPVVEDAVDRVKPVAEAAADKARDMVEAAKEPAAVAVDRINEMRDKLSDQILRNQQVPRPVDVAVEDIETPEEVGSQINDMVEDLIQQAQPADEAPSDPVAAAAEEIANNIDEQQ